MCTPLHNHQHNQAQTAPHKPQNADLVPPPSSSPHEPLPPKRRSRELLRGHGVEARHGQAARRLRDDSGKQRLRFVGVGGLLDARMVSARICGLICEGRVGEVVRVFRLVEGLGIGAFELCDESVKAVLGLELRQLVEEGELGEVEVEVADG
ncbi:hypothetical protein Sjap_019062 [Stephania japonica]|uniref:Uncharacterized protein n=1 Tax=Stephania japonica TaxID=461633 RepID=A0AAP0F3C7_9MAGN